MHVCTRCSVRFVELACYERLCPACELANARQHLAHVRGASTVNLDALNDALFWLDSWRRRASYSSPAAL